MKSTTIATLATTLALISAVNATGAQVKTYTESGCKGDSKKVEIDDRFDCTTVMNVGSAKQDKLDDGVKYTCNAYSDANCKNKIGELFDCVSGSIGSIHCLENPPL